MKLGLIGNCAYQALIDDCARVRWLCWPRFDSSFVFGGLLDEERGGTFVIEPAAEGFQSEQGYLASTNILRTEFSSENAAFEVIDFAPRFKLYGRYFKPTMLIRRVRPLRGCPSIRVCCNPVYDYGRIRPDFYAASNHIQWLLTGAQLRLTSNAPLSYISERRPFALEDTVYLVLTWGEPLQATLAETCDSFLEQTQRYWETWVKHCSIPALFQEHVIRSALVLKLHQYEDTGAITAASTTSIPEYPGSGRNWDYRYCWLRDTCFTLGALRRLGQFEEAELFVSYLLNLAQSSPEHLQPVYGINGEHRLEETLLDHLSGYLGHGPVRIGNQAFEQEQHDVYGEMIVSIAPLFLDTRFRERAGVRSTALLHRLLQNLETRLGAPDAGLWEERREPRVHTFSQLLHWAGARAARKVGECCNEPELARRARTIEERAREIIEQRCWRPELGFYADSPGSKCADASLLMMVNIGFLNGDHPHIESHVRRLAEQPQKLSVSWVPHKPAWLAYQGPLDPLGFGR